MEDLHWKLKRSLVLQVETNNDSVRKHITDDYVAALVTSESTIGAERKLEEEVYLHMYLPVVLSSASCTVGMHMRLSRSCCALCAGVQILVRQ